jgi:hypothetical protein
VDQYLESGLDDLIFHVNDGVAARHGGWSGWLDEVSASVELARQQPAWSPA